MPADTSTMPARASRLNRFAGKHECAAKDEQRRETPRYRINLAEIARFVGLGKREAVAELEYRRCRDVWPTGRSRCGNKH